jgi:hypothetical protein
MLHLEKCAFCQAPNAYYNSSSLPVDKEIEKKVISELDLLMK